MEKTPSIGKSSQLKDWIRVNGVGIGMVVVLIIMGLIEPNFFRRENLLGVLNSSSILVILSIGMSVTLSVRGVNLSIAQTADAAAILAAYCIINRLPWWMACVIAIAFGVLIGAINMFTISYLGVPAIIGTLGMMFVIRSFELVITNGGQPQVLFSLPRKLTGGFLFIGQEKILGGITLLLILTLLIVVIMYFVRERSTLGRRMDAVWDNARTAFLASIHIRHVFGMAFILSGALAGIAGIFVASRTGSATPRGVETFLNDTFVASFLGALLSKRGKVNIFGTMCGAIFVSLLNNWFTLMSFDASLKNTISGIVIICAVAIGTLRSRKK